MADDDVTITVHVRDLSGPGFNSVNRNINQLQRQASQMGATLNVVGGQLGNLSNAASSAGDSMGGGSAGLRGKLIGVAAALGTTLLPTIGAVAPMLTGLAVVGGGAALAMDDLKKKAKELKEPFEAWQKVANKAVAPHTEKAVKSLKGAMKDLTPVVKIGADTFGRITENAARFADSPAFKGALAKNAEMGAKWVEEFAGSVGVFTQSFLDFGTKSQPALDAWDNLLGGFLDRGLPSMFKELEQGISGASDFLDGLAYVINDALLPSLGKISGSFSRAFGPLLKEMLITAGNQINTLASAFEFAMDVLEPFADLVADAFRSWNEVFVIGSQAAASFASSVGGALLESLLSLTGVDISNLDGFHGLSDWVKENQDQIRTAFFNIAGAITSMVTTGITMLPQLYTAFRVVVDGILTGIDTIVSGLAMAFGDLPVIGDRFKDWNTKFDEFATGARSSLDDVGTGIDTLTTEAIPRLNRAQLKMNVDEASQNLTYIKDQLKDPELTKERKAKLTAEKKEADEKLAAAKRELAAFDKKQATAKLDANSNPFWTAIRAAAGAKIPKKTGSITANTSSFWGSIRSLSGRILGTSYIDVKYRKADSSAAPSFSQANGGILNYYADGGENHTAQIAPAGSWRVWGEPETGGEAYIPLAEGKRGRSMSVLDDVAKRFGYRLEKFAKGGMSQATKDARSSLSGSFGISHFGRMAGYGVDPFERSLSKPADIGALVSALNGARGDIRAAFSGKTESRLLKMLDATGRSLLKYEKQLTSVNKALESAKSKLSDLKSAAGSLSSSVKGGVLSSANITRGAGSGPVTVASIMGGLTEGRDKSSAFAKALKDLQKKGVSKDLIQQIAEAGIEGGGLETAGALLGASSSEIQSMNQLQGQINTAATAAGKNSADAVYGAAIKAQTAATARLQKSQDKLEATMANLAKNLEKALQRALAGKAAGGIVGAAASGGIRSNMTWVGEQGPELLDLPSGSRVWSNADSKRKAQAPWASMLNTPRGGRSAAGAPVVGGSLAPIVIQVQFGGRDLGELWVAAGRNEVQARGGSLKATLLARDI